MQTNGREYEEWRNAAIPHTTIILMLNNEVWYEGRTPAGKERWKLQNPRYFGGMYKESEELCNEVADYIDQNYDQKSGVSCIKEKHKKT
jgi:hypothetical protein